MIAQKTFADELVTKLRVRSEQSVPIRVGVRLYMRGLENCPFHN